MRAPGRSRRVQPVLSSLVAGAPDEWVRLRLFRPFAARYPRPAPPARRAATREWSGESLRDHVLRLSCLAPLFECMHFARCQRHSITWARFDTRAKLNVDLASLAVSAGQ